MSNKKITNYLLKTFNKVKINSKNIKYGDVFVALPGKNNHGLIYIQEALDSGANYVITDKADDICIHNANVFIIENVMDYLLLIAKQKRELFPGKVIGITGSIGKTSVKENLNFLLKNFYKVSASIKSYNNFLGVIISLLNLDLSSDYGIFEIGTNNFYEIRQLTSILKPSQAIITNIHPTHLEKLINTNNIAKEKSDIFNLQFNSKIELVILSNYNNDEKKIIVKARKNSSIKTITFGKAKNSSIQIMKIDKLDKLYSKVYLKYYNQIFSFEFNNNQLLRIDNLLICFSIFLHNKIKLEKFYSLSRYLPLIEGRGMEKKIKINNKNVNLIDESYNASPQSMKVSITYFDNLKINKNQKKFLIIGDMKELGTDSIKYHKELINFIKKTYLKNIILCGELMKVALDKRKNMLLFQNQNCVLSYLKENISDNDIILIKGSNSSLTNDIAKILLKGELIV